MLDFDSLRFLSLPYQNFEFRNIELKFSSYIKTLWFKLLMYVACRAIRNYFLGFLLWYGDNPHVNLEVHTQKENLWCEIFYENVPSTRTPADHLELS